MADGYYDPTEEYPMNRPSRQQVANWGAVVIAVLSVATSAASYLWYGGRMEQRFEFMQEEVREAKANNQRTEEVNARQDVTLAIISNQYGEINRRLGGIENRLDK